MSAAPPPLPDGRHVTLPGRGTTFVREVPGPPGAPTVVLLHGWTVSADLNWFTVYETLGRHFRVLAIDHRGHGRGIRSRRRFRLADCADDVAALCEAYGIARVVPVGYSMGGPVALLLWHRHRHLVDGLVLCATAPSFRSAGPESTLFSVLPLVANAARVTPRVLRNRVASRLLDGRTDDTDLGRWARGEIARGDPAAVADAGSSLGRFDARPWLHDVDVPTVVVRTVGDAAVSPQRQRELATGIPGAVLVDVAAGHDACVTAADRFVPALVGALHRVTGAAAWDRTAPVPPR